MLLEKSQLKYKGKVVFEKVRMERFDRIPKFYEENEACFIFLDGGSFSLRTSSNVLKLNSNSAFLSKCVNYFFELPEEESQGIKELEAIGVMIHQSVIAELFDIKLLNPKPTYNTGIQAINIDPLLDAFKQSISYLIDNPSLADDDLIEIKLREFIQLIMRQKNNESIHHFFSTLFDPVIYNIEQTINTNLDANLSIEELAFLTNMSISTFKRKFKEIYDTSPHKYLLRKRIEKASLLLRANKMTVSEVAYACGFDGISTFNRNFKKIKGLSPSKWVEMTE